MGAISVAGLVKDHGQVRAPDELEARSLTSRPPTLEELLPRRYGDEADDGAGLAVAAAPEQRP